VCDSFIGLLVCRYEEVLRNIYGDNFPKSKYVAYDGFRNIYIYNYNCAIQLFIYMGTFTRLLQFDHCKLA